jgi:hypothetical protein
MGFFVGCSVGLLDGFLVGFFVGCSVGLLDGFLVGLDVVCLVGLLDGFLVRFFVGCSVGLLEGFLMGLDVGCLIGCFDEVTDGDPYGFIDGCFEGDVEGGFDGDLWEFVGFRVVALKGDLDGDCVGCRDICARLGLAEGDAENVGVVVGLHVGQSEFAQLLSFVGLYEPAKVGKAVGKYVGKYDCSGGRVGRGVGRWVGVVVLFGDCLLFCSLWR